MSCFAFQFVLCLYTCLSVCLSIRLSVSDEPIGVLLVLVGACDWYSSEQRPLLIGQEEGPAWQNRPAVGRRPVGLTPAR